MPKRKTPIIAYYEAPNAPPPAHLLCQLAETLGISGDVLLEVTEPRRIKRLKQRMNAQQPSTLEA